MVKEESNYDQNDSWCVIHTLNVRVLSNLSCFSSKERICL